MSYFTATNQCNSSWDTELFKVIRIPAVKVLFSGQTMQGQTLNHQTQRAACRQKAHAATKEKLDATLWSLDCDDFVFTLISSLKENVYLISVSWSFLDVISGLWVCAALTAGLWQQLGAVCLQAGVSFSGRGGVGCLLRSDRSSRGWCISHGASWIGCQFALGSRSSLSTYVWLFALVLPVNYYMQLTVPIFV